MTTIRQAFDSYPLKHFLQRGCFDLKPSLALHLAREVDDVSAPTPPSAEAAELMDRLTELLDSWHTQIDQMLGTERAIILADCAQGLLHAVDGDR